MTWVTTTQQNEDWHSHGSLPENEQIMDYNSVGNPCKWPNKRIWENSKNDTKLKPNGNMRGGHT